MHDDLLLRYSRHIMLDEIGEDGQQRLSQARALLVGLGGLGSPAALYLAAAGVGELALCDDDSVELHNLQRQVVHTTDTLGWQKTESAAAHLARINPHCRTVQHGRIAADNVQALVAAADVVVDGSDNYASRHLINRACVEQRTPLVSGAVAGFDGQATVFDVRRADSPCYSCLFPESPECPEDAAADVPCALLGVFAPLAGIIGALQAAEAVKSLLALDGGTLIGRLLLVDGRAMRWRDIRLPRDPNCPVCHAR